MEFRAGIESRRIRSSFETHLRSRGCGGTFQQGLNIMLASRQSMILKTDGLPEGNSDRRHHCRLSMAGAAARLDAMGDRGLCGILDLSQGGVQIETPITLRVGDPVRISFDCTNSMQGRIVWSRGKKAGIQFLAPVVTFSLIRKLAKDRSNRVVRPPRLPVNGSALATIKSNSFPAVVCDISQLGMRVWHAGRLSPGSVVEIALAGSIRVRGTVRWSNGVYAGIQLSCSLAVEQLASMRHL